MSEQLFILDRVEITEAGCWLWQQAINPDGYGVAAKTNLHKRYKTHLVHRLSYILWKGPITKAILVRHTCRNRHCCNPEHLELGTNLQNNHDKYRDRTNNKVLGTGFQSEDQQGSKNASSKLSEEQAKQIRRLRAERKLKYRELAEMFDVSIATIGYICKGQAWRHV